jgi:SAM-dependent methyltransferase
VVGGFGLGRGGRLGLRDRQWAGRSRSSGALLKVIATDASEAQIQATQPHPKVRYRCAPAEAPPIDDGSIDLITVAQALHWFDVEAFYCEAHRVLRPNGVLAVWCYGSTTISPEIDPLVRIFATETIGPCWPEDRRHIEAGYETLPFPYPQMEVSSFEMTVEWNLNGFLSYLRTWSSVNRYMAAHTNDPVDALEETLRPLWGPDARLVRWPLVLKVGCKAE